MTPQERVWHIIKEAGKPLSIQEIHERAGGDKNTVSKQVCRLKAMRLVGVKGVWRLYKYYCTAKKYVAVPTGHSPGSAATRFRKKAEAPMRYFGEGRIALEECWPLER